jgi:16S rRNA (cytosine1402-N4)-methyltransferase
MASASPGVTGSREEAWHVPVLVEEIRRLVLTPDTALIADCTLGTGGHALELLDASPGARLIGLDLDTEALEIAGRRLSEYEDRVDLMHMNFADLKEALPAGGVDALLIDCGISRLQIVEADRGFSFDREGLLDMRFDSTSGATAADILAGLGESELRRLLKVYGEGRRAGRIARAIVRAGRNVDEWTTLGLAQAVKSVVRERAAKSLARVFLALRTCVNKELESLGRALDALPEVLASGGRAAVISYHSVEDRLVKRAFREMSRGCICPPELAVCRCGASPLLRILTPKPIVPSDEEIRANPSARSAKLRVVEKM